MPGPDSTSTRSKIQSAILQTTGKIPIDKTALKQYDRIKKEFTDKFVSYYDRYKVNQINIEQLKGYWTAIIRDTYPVAYKNGLELGMAPFEFGKFDKAWVTGAVNQELTYLNRFVEDIKNDVGVMPYDKRILMYCDTLDSVQSNGFFEAIPDQITIYWELGDPITENCEDCIELANNSPYTKYNLPTLPRSGETKCLSNCLCKLRIEISSKPVRSPREPVDRQTVKLDRDLEKNVKQYFQREIPEGLSLPDDQQRSVLDSLFSDIYKTKGQLSVETDPILKRELILQRQALNDEAINYMAKNKIYYVRSWETVPTSGIKEVPKVTPLTPPIPTGVMLPATGEPFPGTDENK